MAAIHLLRHTRTASSLHHSTLCTLAPAPSGASSSLHHSTLCALAPAPSGATCSLHHSTLCTLAPAPSGATRHRGLVVARRYDAQRNQPHLLHARRGHSPRRPRPATVKHKSGRVVHSGDVFRVGVGESCVCVRAYCACVRVPIDGSA